MNSGKQALAQISHSLWPIKESRKATTMTMQSLKG
jgi:hypothetical protein